MPLLSTFHAAKDSMTYNPSIPMGTDLISSSSTPIRTNFDEADTQFGQDHYGFLVSGANGSGKHKKVSFPGIPDPVPTVTGSQTVLYPNGSNQLIFKNASGSEQITGTTANANANGGLNLPVGIKIRWGTFSTDGTIPYPVSFEDPMTGTYAVTFSAQMNTAQGIGYVSSKSSSGFSFSYSGGATKTYSYIAIGN